MNKKFFIGLLIISIIFAYFVFAQTYLEVTVKYADNVNTAISGNQEGLISAKTILISAPGADRFKLGTVLTNQIWLQVFSDDTIGIFYKDPNANPTMPFFDNLAFATKTDIASIEYVSTSGNNVKISGHKIDTANFWVYIETKNDATQPLDTIISKWHITALQAAPDYFVSLGDTISVAEATELSLNGANIGTNMGNLNTNYGIIIKYPSTNGASDQVVLSVPDNEAVCGDGNIDTGEQCDGINLNGETCVSQGYASGTLSCYPSTDPRFGCMFDVTGCVGASSNFVSVQDGALSATTLVTKSPGSQISILETLDGVSDPEDPNDRWLIQSQSGDLYFQWKDASTGNWVYPLTLQKTGNVGIGTTNPIAPLHIENPTRSDILIKSSNIAGLEVNGEVSSNINLMGGSQSQRVGINFIRGTTNSWNIGMGNMPGNDLFIWNNDLGEPVLVIQETTNNVGIGTITPSAKLDVGGVLNAQGLFITDPSVSGIGGIGIIGSMISSFGGTNGGPLYLQGGAIGSFAYRGIIMQKDGGNVGIGTTNPSAKLVSADANGGSISITTANDVQDKTSVLTLFSRDVNGDGALDLGIIGGPTGDQGWTINAYGPEYPIALARNDLIFYRYDGDQAVPWVQTLVLDSSGNVGLGTNNPGAQLHVNKNTNGWAGIIENTNTLASDANSGLLIKAGEDAFDAVLSVQDKTGGSTFLKVDGLGEVKIGNLALTGGGNALVCVASDGTLYRGTATSCP